MSKKLSTIYHLLSSKRRTYVLAATLPLLAILVPLIYFGLRFATQSQAVWIDDGWVYRTRLTITHNSGLSDQKVKFDIDTATLISAGKMQSDCGDSRFTDLNGRVLSYYLDTAGGACNGASTDYYVHIPTVANGDTIVYHYYGNATIDNGTQLQQIPYTTLTPSTGISSGSEEKGTGPVALWSLNEGSNDTCSGGTNDACDSMRTGIDGAQSGGISWRSSDMCIAGTCIFFDGSDDVLTMTNANPIDMDKVLAGGFTYEAWIRPNSAGEGTGGQIFYKGTNTWLRVDTLANGTLDIEASLDLATTDATLNVASQVSLHRWTHVAFSYTDDGDDEITLWVNGAAVGSSTNGVGSPASDTNDLLIGGTTTNNFHGSMDEFRIYPYERSTAQMITDAKRGGMVEGQSAAIGRKDALLSDGLIGFWKMDESSWTNNCSTSTVLDASGIGNHLRSCPNTTGPTGGVTGKYGSSGTFDGSNDYLDGTDDSDYEFGSSTAQLTFSAWVYPTTVAPAAAMTVLSKYNSSSNQREYMLQIGTTGRVQLSLSGDGSAVSTITGNTTLTANTWQHIAATYDVVTDTARVYLNGQLDRESTITLSTVYAGTASFHIGAVARSTSTPDLFFSGNIDDVRVYNRQISASDIQSLARFAPEPLTYWKLDGNTGTSTVPDSSGNGVALTMGGSPNNNQWQVGKSGATFDFDGTNDEFTSSSSTLNLGTSSFTISAWIVRDTGTTDDVIFSKKIQGLGTNCSVADDVGYTLMIYSTDELGVAICSDSTLRGWEMYSAANAVTVGQWVHVAAVVDRYFLGSSRIYINGLPIATTIINDGADPTTTDSISNGATGGLSLDLGGGFFWDGKLDDVKIYNYARTQGQVIEDMNGGHPIGGSPIGSQSVYWKFDEMQGTTANNAVEMNTDGTLTSMASPATSTSGWTRDGKINSALTFDGSDDKVLIATASDSVVDYNGTEPFAGCAYVYPTTMAGSGEMDAIITKWDTTSTTRAYRLVLTNDDADTTGNFRIELYDESTDQTISAAASSDSVNTNTWYHVCFSFNGGTAGAAGDLKLFVNGVNVANSALNASFLGLEDVTADFTVGDYDATDVNASNTGFTGRLDEVQIYSTDLTTEQIITIMNANAATNFGATGAQEAAQLSDGAGNPPVGYWDFNEAVGAATLLDKSGRENDGTIRSQMSFVTGRYGGGMYFNGSVNSTATTGVFLENNTYDSLTQGSISFWFKPDDLAAGDDFQTMFAVAEQGAVASNLLSISFLENTNEIEYYIGDASTGCNITATFSVPNPTSWNHFSASTTTTGNTIYLNGIRQSPTYSTGSSSSTCFFDDVSDNTTLYTIGCYANGAGSCTATALYEGIIDELRIYDYARTASQVAYDYNRGAPAHWWKLDECAGSTLNDAGGAGVTSNGTITIGASGAQTATGNCVTSNSAHAWSNGASGKFNAGLRFDGTDDYADLGDLPNTEGATQLTWSLWIKPSSIGTSICVICKANSGADTQQAWRIGSSSTATTFMARIPATTTDVTTMGTVANAYNDGTWLHAVVVFDGTLSGNSNRLKIYFDGKQQTVSYSGTIPAALNSTTSNARIGSSSDAGAFYNGEVDDLRIYNYPLSLDQIRKVYNEGAAVRFGPNTGQP